MNKSINNFSTLSLDEVFHVSGGEEITVTTTETKSSSDNGNIKGSGTVHTNGETSVTVTGGLSHTESTKTTENGVTTNSTSVTFSADVGATYNNNTNQVTPTGSVSVSVSK